MKKTFFILATLTFILLPFTTARGDTAYDMYKSAFVKRHPVSPKVPPFKNPMFNGDFVGIPSRDIYFVQLYPDGPVDPTNEENYLNCTMIVNEPDRVVFKCLTHLLDWETYHFLNASGPYLKKMDDKESGEDSCYIVRHYCMEDYCDDHSYIFYRPSDGNDCGPVAPPEEWDSKGIWADHQAFAFDSCGDLFKRDQELRKKHGLPAKPCFFNIRGKK